MHRAFFIFAAVAALCSCSPVPSPREEFKGLTYSVQRDGSMFFTGTFRDQPISFVRKGVGNKGTLAIYSGRPPYRVRLALSSAKGLTEVRTLDTGLRIAVHSVAQERVEYRLFGSDGKFVIGAVLFRNGGRWLQGLMKSETFSNYAALADVQDITQMVTEKAPPTTGPSAVRWPTMELMSSAWAQEEPDGGGSFFSLPSFSMATAALVGAAAFATRLVAQNPAVVRSVALAVVTSPVTGAIVVGVGVGLLLAEADRRLERTLQRRNSAAEEEAFEALERPSANRPGVASVENHHFPPTEPQPEQPRKNESNQPSPKAAASYERTSPRESAPRDDLPAPGGVTVTKSGELRWKLTWSRVDGATGYHIYLQKDSPPAPIKDGAYWEHSGEDVPFMNVDGHATSATHSVEAPGTYYWVVAARRVLPSIGMYRLGFPAKAVKLTFSPAAPKQPAAETAAAAATKADTCIQTVTGCLGEPPPYDARAAAAGGSAGKKCKLDAAGCMRCENGEVHCPWDGGINPGKR